MGTPNSSTDFYDQFAPHYRKYAQSRGKYNDSVDEAVLDSMSGYDMFDVGSGDGIRASGIAARVGARYLLLTEPSSEMHKLCIETGHDSRMVAAEDLDHLEGSFGTITCLWNVLGHVDRKSRCKALSSMGRLLKPRGQIYIDVNNRYNIRAYGLGTVVSNVAKDMLAPSEDNGDVNLEMKLNGHILRGMGHVFNPWEMEILIRRAGLRVARKLFLDYETGEMRATPAEGQLFFQLRR